MRHLLPIALVAACGPAQPSAPLAPDNGPSAEPARIALVETVPVGTELGAPEVADTHRVWRRLVESAERRVRIGQFYAADREGPDRFDDLAEALIAVAARGVTVQVLLDAALTDQYPATLSRLEAIAEVRITEAWDEGVQHAKYLVVDGERLYVGSANLDWRSLEHVHEIGARLDSPVLGAQLSGLFERDWRAAAGERIEWGSADWTPVPLAGGGSVRLLASPAGALPDPEAAELDALVEAFDAAERKVLVQLLDYDDAFRDGRAFDTLDAAIRRAAGRGVRVHLLLSHWQKRDMDPAKALQRVPRVEVSVVTIPEADTGFIPYARVAHAKYAVFDGEVAWIGSSNWKGDYFATGRNVGLLVEDSPLCGTLEAVFARLSQSAHTEAVDPEARYELPRIR